MSEWKEYKLEEIGQVVGGATPSTKEPSYYDGQISWITPKDLSVLTSRYISRGERNITQRGLDSCSCKILPKNSVLFSSRAPIGYVAIANREVCTNQGFKSVIPNENLVYYKFLYYLLLYNKDNIANLGSGTTFMEVSGSVMKNYVVKIPSLIDQKKIASVLSSLDDKIETNRAINARLEELASAIFKSWFIDFEPVAYSEFVEDEYGRRPKGWKIGDIYEIVKIIYGAPYSSEYFNEKEEGLPLIRIRDLKTNQPQIYTKEILQNTEYINPGDIVAGMDAEFIPYMWQGEKGLLNQRCCKIVPNDETISNGFVLNFMKPYLYFIQSYKTGTTVSHLGKSDLDKIKAIIPPKELIIKYSTATKSLFEEICDRSKETTRLASLRDTLLPRLMSGELIPE